MLDDVLSFLSILTQIQSSFYLHFFFWKLLSGGTDCYRFSTAFLVPIIFNLRQFATHHALLPVSSVLWSRFSSSLASAPFPYLSWMFSEFSFLVLPLILLTCWNLVNLDLPAQTSLLVYQCLQQPTRQSSLNMLEAPSNQHDQNQIHYFPTLTFVCSVNTVIYWVSKWPPESSPVLHNS